MCRFISVLTVLLLVGVVRAQEKPKEGTQKAEPVSRAEQFKSMAKESRDAENEFLKLYREAKEKDEKSKAYEAFQAAPMKQVPKMLEFAKTKPEDESACDAAIWVIHRSLNGKEAKEAIELIRKHHLANPKLADVVNGIRFALGEDATPFLRLVIEKSPHRKVKASALLTLANKATDAAVDYTTAENEIAIKSAAAVNLWEQLLRDFSDIEWYPTNIGDRAKAELDMIKNLFPGCKAREISGDDTEGKLMKLSDFKGRVIMLEFWGSWCGPCMQMVPHNIETAKKYADKRFVLVGVNSDRDKTKLAKRIIEEKITYRSFWNGEEGPGGAISKNWNVHGWPTVVLIDQNGIIRRRFFGCPDTEAEWKGLDQALEALVAEAETK